MKLPSDLTGGMTVGKPAGRCDHAGADQHDCGQTDHGISSGSDIVCFHRVNTSVCRMGQNLPDYSGTEMENSVFALLFLRISCIIEKDYFGKGSVICKNSFVF